MLLFNWLNAGFCCFCVGLPFIPAALSIFYFVHGSGLCWVQPPSGSQQQSRLKGAQSIHCRKQLKWFTKVVPLLLLFPPQFLSSLLCITTGRRINIYLDFPLFGLVCSSLELKLSLCLIVSHSISAFKTLPVLVRFGLHIICNLLHFLKCYFVWSKDHAQILWRGKAASPREKGSGTTSLRG